MTYGANRSHILVLAAALSLSASCSLLAQRTAKAAGRTRVPAARTPARVATPTNPSFAPITTVPGAAPGLGFDYEHLAAVSRPQNAQRRTNGRSRFITPIFNGSLPLYYPFAYSDTGINDDTDLEPQPVANVIEDPEPAPVPPTRPVPRAPAAAAATAPAPPPVPQQPVPDIGQLILVRRGGEVLMAAGFTISGDRLTYVTREGARHTFPISELDVEATQKRNDENGTTVNLPK